MLTRRDWMTRAALLGGTAVVVSQGKAFGQATDPHAGHGAAPPPPPPEATMPGMPGMQSMAGMDAATESTVGQRALVAVRRELPPPPSLADVRAARRELGYTPVSTPDGVTANWRRNGAWKEFHLVAHEIAHEFAPGMVVKVWGYNGGTPGPTIEAVEGDWVRIFVTNHLPEHTTIHWHGIFLPNGMDGVGGLLQPHIQPGETYVYEFKLGQHGTFMYHPHSDEMVQMALGMMGFFVVHPRQAHFLGENQAPDRDFCILPHMWAIHPGEYRPDPMVMLDFDLFTFNGRAYPGTSPLVVRRDDRVRFRFANLSMTSHPIHVHGHRFWLVETDGGQVPKTAWVPDTTLNSVAGQTRAVEFVADAPGDWPLHCHKSHHAMNAMGHDLPNPVGADTKAAGRRISRLLKGYMAMGDSGMAEHAQHAKFHPLPENTLPMMTGEGPFGPIEMGGMFTVVKVRDGIESYADPGWFEHPQGTVARKLDSAPGGLADEWLERGPAALPVEEHQHGGGARKEP
ncbi:MAG: copper oxidase [Thermoanaerobaculia bacterium]